MVLIHKIVSHALQTGGASTLGKTGIELQEQAWERDPEKSVGKPDGGFPRAKSATA